MAMNQPFFFASAAAAAAAFFAISSEIGAQQMPLPYGAPTLSANNAMQVPATARSNDLNDISLSSG
jgi:hypothetical protein